MQVVLVVHRRGIEQVTHSAEHKDDQHLRQRHYAGAPPRRREPMR
jgi:hypothetical protein